MAEYTGIMMLESDFRRMKTAEEIRAAVEMLKRRSKKEVSNLHYIEASDSIRSAARGERVLEVRFGKR